MSAVATAEFSNGRLIGASLRPLSLSTVKTDEAPRGPRFEGESRL
jgi:hypothetical protein